MTDSAPDHGRPSGAASRQADAAKSRDARLDALRGLAIAFVVVQHLGWVQLSYREAPGLWPTFPGTWANVGALGSFWYGAMVWTGPFCVQLFAFVSGYLMPRPNARSFESFAGGRFLGLMVPFLAWATVYWLDPQTSAFFLDKGSVWQYLLAGIKNPNGGFVGPIWFLPALFLSSVAVFAARRISHRPWVLLVLAALSVLFARYLGALGGGSYFGVLEATRFLPFVVAGTLLRTAGRLAWKRSWVRLALALGAFIGLFYLMPTLAAPLPLLPIPFNTPAAVAQQVLPALLWALAGIWLCVEFVAALPERAVPPVAWLGVNSLGICGAHLLAYAAMVALGVDGPWLAYPLVLGMSAALSWLLGLTPVTRTVFLGGRLPGRTADRAPAVAEGATDTAG